MTWKHRRGKGRGRKFSRWACIWAGPWRSDETLRRKNSDLLILKEWPTLCFPLFIPGSCLNPLKCRFHFPPLNLSYSHQFLQWPPSCQIQPAFFVLIPNYPLCKRCWPWPSWNASLVFTIHSLLLLPCLCNSSLSVLLFSIALCSYLWGLGLIHPT